MPNSEVAKEETVLGWFVNIFVENFEGRFFQQSTRGGIPGVIFLVRVLGVVFLELFSDPGTYPG